jgi:hypothetical protein
MWILRPFGLCPEIEHVREDVGKIGDPRGQVLFETTA